MTPDDLDPCTNQYKLGLPTVDMHPPTKFQVRATLGLRENRRGQTDTQTDTQTTRIIIYSRVNLR